MRTPALTRATHRAARRATRARATHCATHRIPLLALLLSALQLFSLSALSFPAPLKPDTAELAAITTARYPDADGVIVEQIARTHYAADGTAASHFEFVIKILTEKGLRESRMFNFHYNIFYEDTAITLAQLIHHDGTATPIDIAANTKEMTDRSMMGMNIYDPDNKILTLAIPGLKIGDTLHIIKETTTKRPRMKDTFCDWQSFEHTSPVIRCTYEIRGPKGKPLLATAVLDKIKDSITATTRDEGDDRVYTWTARDIPQAFPEPSMPAFSISTQRLLVSTAANWEDVSKWYSAISEPHLAPTPEIRAKVAELIAPPGDRRAEDRGQKTEDRGQRTEDRGQKTEDGRQTNSLTPPPKPPTSAAQPPTSAAQPPSSTLCPPSSDLCPPTSALCPLSPELTDDEKIRRIFTFVSQEIRYMGITVEKTSPGYEPHDVALTFNNRYGVCRDKAALLVTMLRVAGFDASPVLINAGPLVDPEVPKIYFNHAITAVRRANGSYTLMDSTDENTADLLPSYLANKSYLVARAEGDTLRTSPLAPPDENMLRAATRLAISDDGNATGAVTLDFTGINDNAYRTSFARAKPEDIRRWLESLVKNQLPGATLTAHEITPRNVMDTTQPLRVTFSFTAPDYLAVARDKTLLNIPWFGADFSIAARFLGSGASLAKRRFPLEIPYTCGLDETIAIQLPPRIGDTLALPDATHIALPAATYDKTFTRDAATLTGRLSMRLRAPQVAPGEPYAQLKDALKNIEYSNRQSPIFAARPKTELAPDIRTFSDDLAITLTDAHNWTRTRAIKKQILTYAGKKNHAEMRFNYNPVWETMTLDTATVTLKDGGTRTVSPDEINIMDAAWVSAAPRYPAAKTMVVSLPGVEEGGIIEYKVTTTAKNKPWFSLRQSYFSFDPVDNYTFTLAAPTAANLTTNADLAANLITATTAIATDPANANTTTATNAAAANLITVAANADPAAATTTAANATTIATANATVTHRVTGARPAAPREGGLPPASHLGPVYEVTTITNPADYARLINASVAPLAVPTDAIRKQAAGIFATAGAQTDTDRVTAIRDYVARHIRNAGPNFTDLPLSCLTPAEKTLADHYGHAADRAILLAALLRSAGLQPELLLAAPRTTSFLWTDKDLFPIDSFDNLTVRVTADGKPCYLNQLSIYADPRATSLDGCMVIPLATGKLETITLDPVYQTRADLYCDITLAPNGDATVTYKEPHHGVNHANLKRMFKEMTPEDLTRFHQDRMTWISQAAVPNGDIVTDLDYPATLSFSANVPRYAVRSGDYLYFQLPAAGTSPTPAGPDTRIHPLFAASREDATTRWTITLPENTEVETAPENLTWTGPGDYGQVTITTNITKSETARTVLEVTQTIRLNPAVIPAASYTTLLEINRRLSQPTQWRVLLKTQN